MKFTFKIVKESVGIIFPQYLKCKEAGIEVNLPKWLSMVAEQYFIEHFDQKDGKDIRRMEAFYVCHNALCELKEKGWMDEGTRDTLAFRDCFYKVNKEELNG